jgi:hypothetical protein
LKNESNQDLINRFNKESKYFTLLKISELHIRLNNLIETIKNDSVEISIVEQSIGLLNQFIADEKFRKKFSGFAERKMEKVKTSFGITINEDQKTPFFLFSAYLRWMWVDQEGPNLPLFGGFAFKQGAAMMDASSDSWKKEHEDFLEFETSTPEAEALLTKLVWFESPTSANSSTFAPYYGCVLPNEKTFPHEFYFYDGGIIYPLPFQTFEAYLLALIANAGVECWQYFYVGPEQLIQKNKGLNYMTTALRKGTRLTEDLTVYEYDPSLKFDRLDLIHEHIQRCVTFLPAAFPTLNLEQQRVYLEQLESLL